MDTPGRTLPSLLYMRGKQMEYLRRGSEFRKTSRRGGMETAVISDLYTDGWDIPHVRYHVVFKKPYRLPVKEGPRVLSAKEFFRRFPDRVAGGQPLPEGARLPNADALPEFLLRGMRIAAAH